MRFTIREFKEGIYSRSTGIKESIDRKESM